jgi:glucose/arabinose dehydrogenase
MSKLVATIIFFLTTIVVSAATTPFEYITQNIVIAGKSYTVTIPKGYRLELLTEQLNRPRLLTFAANGDLFIGSGSDTIYRLPPPYTRPEKLVELDGYPHSIAFRKSEILIARTDGLYHAPYRQGQQQLDEDEISLLAPLSDSGGHSSRSVATGPDGGVYVSLGISGNCSDEYLSEAYRFSKRRGGVLKLVESTTGNSWTTFASGLRNPIGFDWHPLTGEMYASNNGPDHHGFNRPPEYFSRLLPGSFHGMPWFQYDGRRISRDNCIKSKPPRSIKEVTRPVLTFPARNAPMGVAFIPDYAMSAPMKHDAIVALHGSWATQPDGRYFGDSATRRHPKIVIVRFDNEKAQRVDDLITGFQLANGERWARPVGVTLGTDGALYFTSDAGTHALFRLKKINKNRDK